MATIFPAPKSGSSSSYVVGARGGAPHKSGGNGLIRFIGNAAADIKDTVVGLPAGLVQTVKHPIDTARLVAGQEWQTWSPLFTGHPDQFLRQAYDHPLAPLLDVMTVFTLGVGAAARSAEVLEAAGAEGRAVKALSGLRTAKSVKLSDYTGQGRQDVFVPLSTKPGRRIVQEAKLKLLTPQTGQASIEGMNLKTLAPHLPKWWANAKYERALRKDIAHRQAATNQILADQLQTLSALKAGEVLSDPAAWHEARQAIVSNVWQGLERHAPQAVPGEAPTALSASEIAAMRKTAKDYSASAHRLSKQANRLSGVEAQAARARDRLLTGLTPAEREQGRMQREADRAAESAAKVTAAAQRRVAKAQAAADKAEHQLLDTLTNPLETGHTAASRHASAHNAARVELRDAKDALRRAKRQEADARKASELIAKAAPAPRAAAEQDIMRHTVSALSAGGTKNALRAEATRSGELAAATKQQANSAAAAAKEEAANLPQSGADYAFILDPQKLSDKVSKLGTPEEFEEFLHDFGKQATTRNAAHAFRRDDGTYPLVPVDHAHLLGAEGAHSSAAVRWLWERPTRAWKIAMVGYAPRTVINNGVGNWLMYAIRQGGDHSIAGLYDAIRITKGERYAKKMAAGKLYGARDQSWAYKWHMDELGNTFAHATGLDGATAKTRVGKILSQGFYPIVHSTADKPVRLAALSAFYRGAPEVRALMKKGYKFDDAVDAAVTNNPELRAAASERVRTVAGDYVTLNSVERPLRNIVPFYLWDRHILKSAGATVAETPGRVAALQKISNMGEEETKKVLGEMPDFLKGALPLSLLGLHAGKGGRVNVLLTSGINPYETLAELASTGEALTTGTGQHGTGLNAALFGVNPLLTGTVEAATGRSLLTGAPIQTHGGVIPSVLRKTTEDLPIPKLAEALTSPAVDTSEKGNQLLYRHDVVNPASSLLGIPLRSVGKTASAKYARAQQSETPRF